MNDKTLSQTVLDMIIEKTIKHIRFLEQTKGGEYATDRDRLHNFRHNAEDCGVPMEIIWRVYAGKHWDAISSYIRDIVTGTKRPRSEPIEGRIDDLIVYLILLKAIIYDGKTSEIVENKLSDGAENAHGY